MISFKEYVKQVQSELEFIKKNFLFNYKKHIDVNLNDLTIEVLDLPGEIKVKLHFGYEDHYIYIQFIQQGDKDNWMFQLSMKCPTKNISINLKDGYLFINHPGTEITFNDYTVKTLNQLLDHAYIDKIFNQVLEHLAKI